MASFDTILEHGTIVDGTGAARQTGAIGIRDGQIAAMGDLHADSAERRIDATGKIVAPGFIDIHTHYDAQVFWDPALTPSSNHGVTTIVGGNCGFSIAPLIPAAGDYLQRMLARVEGMPLAALQKGVPWNWTSFADYLSRFEESLVINAGFLVGHSALRRVVMGEDAVGKEASDEQLEAMVRLLHESIEGGGLGFSSSVAPTHNDGDGQPVPSRHASNTELIELAGAIRDHEGTSLEFLPGVGAFTDDEMNLMVDLSCAAKRALNWNVLAVNSYQPEHAERQLAASDLARERGGRILALTLPQVMTLRLNFVSGFIFDALPGFAPILALPHEEKKKKLADPEVRAELDRRANSPEAGAMGFFANWSGHRVDETFSEETRRFEGRSIGEIAKDLGKSPFDTMMDIVVADDLRTSFKPDMAGDDDASWKLRAEVWKDERTVIGASDAGAHLDMIDTFAVSTMLLGPAVRERQLMSLEEGVHQLTQIPAELYGLEGRGRLTEGAHADLVVFDEAEIGAGPVHTRYDLPGGAGRLYAEAKGIDRVLVAGEEILRAGQLTGKAPGRVMRSGQDTCGTAL
ncbi:MAG: amidohydrolase family protein [Deltaproteobacteria bacterium]